MKCMFSTPALIVSLFSSLLSLSSPAVANAPCEPAMQQACAEPAVHSGRLAALSARGLTISHIIEAK